MTYPEFLIIYFAFAAPFGMRSLLSLQKPLSPAAVLIVMASAFAWPLTAGIALFSSARRYASAGWFVREPSEVPECELRVMMERSIDWRACGLSIFEFREAFERFNGLKSDGVRDRSANEQNDIFEAAGHDSPLIANACLARRNNNRLERHLGQARDDLRRFLEFADLTDGVSSGMTALLEELGMSVHPNGTEPVIAAETSGVIEATNAGDIWSTQAKSRSASM